MPKRLLLFILSSVGGLAVTAFTLFFVMMSGYDPAISDSEIGRFNNIFFGGSLMVLIVSSIFSVLFVINNSSPYRYAYLTLPLYAPLFYIAGIALYFS